MQSISLGLTRRLAGYLEAFLQRGQCNNEVHVRHGLDGAQQAVHIHEGLGGGVFL